MPRCKWTFHDTVQLVDHVEKEKYRARWTYQQRDNLAQKVRDTVPYPNGSKRSIKSILRRIETLGRNWSAFRTASALYRYGWDALPHRWQRAELLKSPCARLRPYSKSARAGIEVRIPKRPLSSHDLPTRSQGGAMTTYVDPQSRSVRLHQV